MLQLANVFLSYGYNVTIVLVELPSGLPGFGAGIIHRLTVSNPSISFHVLPQIPDSVGSSGKPPLFLMLELMHRYNDELEAFLLSIPRHGLHSLVTSMFTTHAVEVASKLNVPVYTFFASAAATLASVLRHPEDDLFRAIMDAFKRCTDTDGILINKFESLESRTVQALRDPQCVPGWVLRPIYCVGPLVGLADEGSVERHDCLTWLDAQPERSVVFICFGSRGLLSAEQLREIAIGLDKSGHRFLWTVRKPAGDHDSRSLDTIFPEGFLERTKDRGIVIESWAPQVDVLWHPSTGAFVTHCGWNSTLEAITYGVPMLCWPLYAEQKLNKVLITDAMSVGMEMEGYRAGFIKAKEVETKLKLVMESEVGRELRAQVVARKDEARAALEDGGSSHAAFLQFLTDVNNLAEQEEQLGT
ncbi:hypothetical protein EJB05_44677, partial [Eragrostis curvula]